MIEVREYVTAQGRSPFGEWIASLNARAKNRILRAIVRIEDGNLGDHRSVGAGVFEHRIHFGPGYRMYFGRDGETLIILLGGGTKKRQSGDIAAAKALWREYSNRSKDRCPRATCTKPSART